MAETTLVLASGSPRRAELLGRLGVPFEVLAPQVDESPRDGERPEDYVRRVALDKAEAAARLRPDAHILAADTEVVLDGATLGKPAGPAEAERMLTALSGRAHSVVTTVVLREPGGPVRCITRRAHVRFASLDPTEIRDYVSSGEPLDKAGSYGLQGLGAVLVAEVRGDPTTVIGLPLRPTRGLLRAGGVIR